MKDVVSHADFTSEHVKTLQQLGGLKYQGRDLFEEVKAVSFGLSPPCSFSAPSLLPRLLPSLPPLLPPLPSCQPK